MRTLRPLAALALALAVTACTTGSPARLATDPGGSGCRFEEGFPASGVEWAGSGARLSRRGPRSRPRSRLVADVRDARGGVTEFLVDTGTSCAFVSAQSPAAATAAFSTRTSRLVANEGATAFDGRDATIPLVDLGGLAARDVPAFSTDRVHDLQRPSNVAGMAWLATLALVHDASRDEWWLSPSTGGVGAGPGVSLEGPAFPVVSLVDDSGARVYGLIDTGTPQSLIESGRRAGRYRLLGDDGRPLLSLEARSIAPWTGLAPRGRDIAVWIGLDDLARVSFRLDFATGRLELLRPASATAAATPLPAR